MSYINYSYPQLKTFCNDAFKAFGFTEAEAETITDVLLLSDLYGIESHGMQRLVRYHKGIEKGLIKVDAKPEIVYETPVSAVIDGHDGMGQLISVEAMKLAIEKAKTTGMAIVSVKNSNHFGIAGYYAKMACDAGLIGFAMTNSEAIMVPTYSRLAMLGSNPIAISMPAEPYPFFFDSSTTVVTRGKLEVYNKLSKPLPEGWALDENGKPSKFYYNGYTYDVTAADGTIIGSFQKDFAASLLRSSFHLRAPGIEAYGQERNAAIAIIRRFVDLPLAFHFDFTDQDTGAPVLTSERQFSMRDRYTVTVPDQRVDFRLAASLAVGLDALMQR